MIAKVILPIILAPLIYTLSACSDPSHHRTANPAPATSPAPEPLSEAQLLREQLGDGAEFFTDQGMQQLLDFEDTASAITLLQFMSVNDSSAFASYESEVEALWQSVGGHTQFSSQVFAQLIGDQAVAEVRAISFPNISMLLDVMNNAAFTAAMNSLFSSTDAHTWVLGIETALPFDPDGSYFDPALQNIDESQAREMLQGNSESGFDSDEQIIIDMIVSDDPSPFWMVNLIDFFDKANYSDGRETDLSGAQANEIYGQAILPSLLAYNSLPELLMPVSVVLTAESVDWEEAAIVRYASRDAFLNIFPLNPHADSALIHKEAGVETTRVYATANEQSNLPAPNSGLLYNFRYCEVLLASNDGDRVRAEVYNSMGLGFCPQEEWDKLDAKTIAEEFGADWAILNGVRFWVLDLITVNLNGDDEPIVEEFSGIPMRLGASVLLPAGIVPGGGDDTAYQVSEVERDTIWHYAAGRQIYELQDSLGQYYVMQSFSRAVDENLQLEDLQSLGRRLTLPQGWSFSTRILNQGFQLPSIDGVADVVTDDLSNTYQRVP